MRDIIFRGKAICGLNAGRWIYGYYVKDFWAPSSVGHGIIPADRDIGGYCEVYPDTVGQYTGLKDKNGKRIFEGDICTSKNGIYKIIWQDKLHGWYCEVAKSRCTLVPQRIRLPLWHWDECEQNDWDRLEIIGNIHDNPELLKGGDSDA